MYIYFLPFAFVSRSAFRWAARFNCCLVLKLCLLEKRWFFKNLASICYYSELISECLGKLWVTYAKGRFMTETFWFFDSITVIFPV